MGRLIRLFDANDRRVRRALERSADDIDRGILASVFKSGVYTGVGIGLLLAFAFAAVVF